MARPKRSDINDQNRRQDILLAASRLFNEKGYHGTSIRDIAAATKMQSGSPFYHFANKQELLFTVIVEGLQPLVEELEILCKQNRPPLERLRTMVLIHVNNMIGVDVNTVATVATEWRFLEGAQIKTVKQLRDRIDLAYQQVLNDLCADGHINDSDAPLRLFFLGALTNVRNWYRQDGTLTTRDIAELLVDFLLHGG